MQLFHSLAVDFCTFPHSNIRGEYYDIIKKNSRSCGKMFNLINMFIIRPIVNVLFVIYDLVGDFGLAVILFTLLVKLAMWPAMKRQLHQARMMRKIQPELAEIKKRCNGNRQMESLQMMDLYKRKNIKPMRTFVVTFAQLPIFIALFTAINVSVRPCAVTDDVNVPVSRCANKTNYEYNVKHSAYSFIQSMDKVSELIKIQDEFFAEYQQAEDKSEVKNGFKPMLFGKIDLSVEASDVFSNFSLSTVIVMLFTLGSACAQYLMAKMNNARHQKGAKKRTLKTIMQEAAEGKEASQEDINAITQSQMTVMMPLMMLFIMINLPGALALYYLVNNTITIVLQKIVFAKNLEDMEESADKKILKELSEAKEAEIINKKAHYTSDSKNKDENLHITRIKSSDNKKKRR